VSIWAKFSGLMDVLSRIILPGFGVDPSIWKKVIHCAKIVPILVFSFLTVTGSVVTREPLRLGPVTIRS
jgi:hypothetical protein